MDRRCKSCGIDLDRPGPELCSEERDGYHVLVTGPERAERSGT